MLSSSEEESGEEKKGESEGSAMEEAPAPCSPQGVATKKMEKVREKRRKRKERRRAAAESRWLEEDVPELPPHYGWSGYCGTWY